MLILPLDHEPEGPDYTLLNILEDMTRMARLTKCLIVTTLDGHELRIAPNDAAPQALANRYWQEWYGMPYPAP